MRNRIDLTVAARKIVQVAALLLLASTLSACVVIEDGQMGVSKSFGKIAEDALPSGAYFSVPIFREIEPWNIKTQRRSMNLDIPSAEGLIVKIQSTVLFRPTQVVKLRKEIGPNFVETVLDSTLINTFREVIGKRKVEGIITEQESLTTKAFGVLRDSMGPRGIMVERLMITGLELPPTFKEAIERKLGQEQKAFQKQFELIQATKDAEIEVARAKGAAEAQEIVRSTLSKEYLQYLWIKTLNENPNVIYVATEANMPMFRTSKGPKGPVGK
jgi:regulator of protease activity HflC (stomatin/prohibitin superfamily)